MTSTFSSYLTSPVIRLIPSPPSSHPTTDTQYIVHRALLTAQSPFLKKRTRESYILLEDTTEATVSLFLEWLYQGDYTIPTSALEDEEEESTEEEELHPVVAAAMGGAVGVWAKKAAVFGRRYEAEKERTEGLQSKYVVFGKDGKVALKSQTIPQTPKQIHALLSPPDSPTALDSDKKFFVQPSTSQSAPITTNISLTPPAPTTLATPPKSPKSTPESLLAAHLAVHIFSLRYQIPRLAYLSLVKLSACMESHSPTPETLVSLLKAVYYDDEESGCQACLTKGKGSGLREFLARYTASRLDEVKGVREFRELLGKGGEFAVDLVGCVGLGAWKGDIWVR